MNAHEAIGLIGLATDYASRADEVRQEPAVVKAFHEFRHDARVAAKSGGSFAHEVNNAWRRSGRREASR